MVAQAPGKILVASAAQDSLAASQARDRKRTDESGSATIIPKTA